MTIHLHDPESLRRLGELDLAPDLRKLLTRRVADLGDELLDITEFLIVRSGDTEADIVSAVGFSPLVEPFGGTRFGQPDFHPGGFDWIADCGGWFEMTISFGGSFGIILLIEDAEGVPDDLRRLCRMYAGQ